jgi:hypothetical protein
MLFKKIVAVYFKNHAIHINKLCGQSADFLDSKAGGVYNYCCDLRVNCYGIYCRMLATVPKYQERNEHCQYLLHLIINVWLHIVTAWM